MLKVRRTRSQMQSKLLDNISNETGSFYGHWTIKDMEQIKYYKFKAKQMLDEGTEHEYVLAQFTGLESSNVYISHRVLRCPASYPLSSAIAVCRTHSSHLFSSHRSSLCYIELRSRPGKARFAFSLSPWTQCQNSRSG